MFAPTYFAPSYFAPRYFPPAGDGVIVTPGPSGNRGGRAAGGPGRKPRRIGKKRLELLAEEALQRAREEGRLRKFADIVQEQGGEAIEWLEDNLDQVQDALVSSVEKRLKDQFGVLPERAFQADNVRESMAFKADTLTRKAIDVAADTLRGVVEERETKKAELDLDDEDVIELLLLGLW